MTGGLIAVHINSIEAAINNILREWRDFWPGGLEPSQYATLNLMAHCRQGGLGYNQAKCTDCGNTEWYASSCGDRHCPNCLGPRQAKWSEQVCDRLPDCPHFHVVFTVPEQWHDFFERNYRIATRELFGAAAETLKGFQKNNWGMDGGFLGVLHTWGSALNWHPHLHLLVSSGGISRKTGKWRTARPNYLFPVKAMSKVFRAIMLRRIEALDGEPGIEWPDGLESVEARRDWRLRLSGKAWNIFAKPTLGNTRAVVRYLARYTSRIAMSNARIKDVDEEKRLVRFDWRNYRKGGRVEEREMDGKTFVRSFVRHLVPKGLRRMRYFGWLAGPKNRSAGIPGSPSSSIGEKALKKQCPECSRCEGQSWRYTLFFQRLVSSDEAPRIAQGAEVLSSWVSVGERFSLVQPRAAPLTSGSTSRMMSTSYRPDGESPG